MASAAPALPVTHLVLVGTSTVQWLAGRACQMVTLKAFICAVTYAHRQPAARWLGSFFQLRPAQLQKASVA